MLVSSLRSATPRFLFAALLSSVFTLFVETPIAHSEDHGSVNLFVRTIQATDPIDSDHAAQQAQSTPKIDGDLSDISSKLSQLPFSSFRIIASKNETHSLRKRETMQLPNGQSLTFRPMYVDNKRVGLWLNWKESDGSEILNTRVHFDADDAVVTGTDCPENKGLIIAIKAIPVANPESAQTGK